MCLGSSAKSQITDAEMADHTGKAFEMFSNWVLFENMWDIGDFISRQASDMRSKERASHVRI